MRLLIDTNVFIEVLFDQPRAEAARQLLSDEQHELFISNFALHSVGVIMSRRHRVDRFPTFLTQTILSGHVAVLSLSTAELAEVADTAQLLTLDFDDAYQYLVAETHNLTLVSFDKDFDRTPRGRQSPETINQLSQ